MEIIVTHEMKLKGNVWTCTECDRAVQVEPMKILNSGDTDAQHYGGSVTLIVELDKDA